VRRTGELQERFDFGKQRVKRDATELQWPSIIAGDPAKYPGIMQTLAAMALCREHEASRAVLKGTANTSATASNPDALQSGTFRKEILRRNENQH
jgi:hypothetical protein